MSIKSIKGQIILIIVFALTFALFSIFMLLAPIKDKLLKIKDMESVYQAIANSEKGLEASLLYEFKNNKLNLSESPNSNPSPDCGGLNLNNSSGTCGQKIYTPNFNQLWNKEKDNFTAYSFTFTPSSTNITSTNITNKNKIISDGISGKNIRTSFIGTVY